MASLPRSARALIAQPGLQQFLCRGQIRLASTATANKAAGKTGKKSNQDKEEQSSLILPAKQDYTTGVNRLREHYRTTVQDDLMVLTYNHQFKPKKVAFPDGVRVELKGNKHIKPVPKPSSPTRIPELVKIDVHCMMKEALTSKFNLLSGFMAIQSITGEMPEIIRSRKGVHTWKLRAGKCTSQIKHWRTQLVVL
jgi:large subunit ribosomal protein L5